MTQYTHQPAQSSEPATDVLMTTKEVAEFLQVSPSTMYRLLETRKIPFYKVAGLIRISRKEVDAYLNLQKVDNTTFHKSHGAV